MRTITLNRITLALIVSIVCILPISLSPVHATTNYTYVFHGPLFYDGSIPLTTTSVSCAMLWVNGTVDRFYLNATGGTSYDNLTVVSVGTPAYQILWNASSLLNYTSTIDFQPLTSTQNINIYIPSSATPSYVYTFKPTDFFGMTHAYLECAISTDGSSYKILQQADLSSATQPNFVLAQYGTYQLSFLCDQGTFSQMFTAQNSFSTELPVLAGSFPTTNSTIPTTTVQRLNSSMVGIIYTDPTLSTNWVSVDISHLNGVTVIYDYSTNNTGNSQTILWNGADADKVYNVNVTAKVGTNQYLWSQIAGSAIPDNPFLGLFDFLGQHVDTLPYVSTGWPEGMTSLQIAQLVGSGIIVLFLCIGSFRSAGACCIIAWILAGVLMYLGWWGNSTTTYSTVPMFILAGFVGFLVHLGEAKQTERDV